MCPSAGRHGCIASDVSYCLSCVGDGLTKHVCSRTPYPIPRWAAAGAQAVGPTSEGCGGYGERGAVTRRSGERVLELSMILRFVI